jgi:hypothetical protein
LQSGFEHFITLSSRGSFSSRGSLFVTRLPPIRYASDRRRICGATLDVSASGRVGESSTCRERESGTDNDRSGKHDLSGRKHCHFLSAGMFAVSATAKQRGPIATFEQIIKFVDYSRGALLQANGSIKEL